MKEYPGPDSMLPMSARGVSTKIFLSGFWTIFINGLPNLETASMRRKNC
jgi:hypothetical protein